MYLSTSRRARAPELKVLVAFFPLNETLVDKDKSEELLIDARCRIILLTQRRVQSGASNGIQELRYRHMGCPAVLICAHFPSLSRMQGRLFSFLGLPGGRDDDCRAENLGWDQE